MVRGNGRLYRRGGMLCLDIRRRNRFDVESSNFSDSPPSKVTKKRVDHRQGLLQTQNGVIALLRPTIRVVPECVQPGWLPTALDQISQDLYPHEPRRHDTVGPWRRSSSGPSRRKYLNQKELCFDRGRLTYKRRVIPTRSLGPIQTLAFMEIPREVREQIYKELLGTVQLYELSDMNFGEDPPCWRLRIIRNTPPRHPTTLTAWPEILATCSQIYHEARYLLFRENRFHPTYYDPREWAEQPLDDNEPYRVPSTEEIHSIRSIYLGEKSCLYEDRDLLVFRDFISMTDLFMDFRGQGLVVRDIGRAPGAMGAFTMLIASVLRHRSQLHKYSCRMDIGTVNTCICRSVGYVRGDVDTIETSHALTFEIHRDEKRHVESELAAEDLLQGAEFEWTFQLTYGSPLRMDAWIQFGWGDKSWPRDSGGRKMIKCELIEEAGEGDDVATTTFVEDA